MSGQSFQSNIQFEPTQQPKEVVTSPKFKTRFAFFIKKFNMTLKGHFVSNQQGILGHLSDFDKT